MKKPIVVLTDHDATRGIVNQTSLNTTSTDRANRRLVNASIYLSAYPLEVYHLAGKLNLVPDALSRLPGKGDTEARQQADLPVLDDLWDHRDFALLVAEARMPGEMKERFIGAYKNDSIYGGIINDLTTPPSHGRKPMVRKDNEVVVDASKPGHPFRLADSLLYNRDNDGVERLVVPRPLVPDILHYFHDEKHHFGRNRMMQDMDGLHFRKKRHLVEEYVAKCHQCGAIRPGNQLPVGDYQPIQAPLEPMHTITMDFITALPKVSSEGTPWHHKGFDCLNSLLTTTCKSSKRTLLVPGHDKYTAEDWAEVLARHLILADWSCPKVIISDRDAKFTSKLWNALWKAFGTRLMMTTAWHPQSDGQSEQKNKIVELGIRHYTYEYPDSPWVDVIPSLQWHLNGAYTKPLDATPHEYLFGFKLPGPLDRLTQSSIPRNVAELRFLRDAIRREAQLAMDTAAALAKRYYDTNHRQVEFNSGDDVWLALGKYKMPGKIKNKKTSPRREGPYKIKRKVTSLAYELELPHGSRIHPVVSIQYLTPYNCHDDPFERRPAPPGPLQYDEHAHSDSSSDNDEVYEIERIIDHRPKKGKIREYLVRWKGYSSKDDHWKTVDELKHSRDLIDEYLAVLKKDKELKGKTRNKKSSRK